MSLEQKPVEFDRTNAGIYSRSILEFAVVAGIGPRSAQVAIYTDHFHHLSVLRKVLLRMRSWQNYIYMEGH